jgi:hypothetical protein
MDDSSPMSLGKQSPLVAKVEQQMVWVDALETQLE